MKKSNINFVERNKQNVGKSKTVVAKNSNASQEGKSTSTNADELVRNSSSTENGARARQSMPENKKPSRQNVPIRNSVQNVSIRNSLSKKSTVTSSPSVARRSANSVQKRNPLSVIKSQNGRPTSAPASSKLTKGGPRATGDELDIITKLFKRNIHEALIKIFLPLDSTTLTACREVCRVWAKYFKNVFWRENRVLNEMRIRLADNWRNGHYSKVQLEVTSGIACKKKCEENFRNCTCGDKLQCQVSENCLILEFGGDKFSGLYKSKSLEEGGRRVEKSFPIFEHQLRFHLKEELKMESSDWLTSIVFIKTDNRMRLSVNYKMYTITRHPADLNSILIKNSKSKEVIQKVILYTENDDNFNSGGILDLHCSGGRLAAIIGGRVYVYDFNKLLEGGSRIQAKLFSACDDVEDVHYLYLCDNFLLFVSGCQVTLYNFWKYTPTSAIKDFEV